MFSPRCNQVVRAKTAMFVLLAPRLRTQSLGIVSVAIGQLLGSELVSVAAFLPQLAEVVKQRVRSLVAATGKSLT